MNLRLKAVQHVQKILENTSQNAVNVKIITPEGVEKIIAGWSNDIYLLYDPVTGAMLNNRLVHLTFSLSTLYEAGLEEPIRRDKNTERPWIFSFSDPGGVERKFTVLSPQPDRTLNILTLALEPVEEEV